MRPDRQRGIGKFEFALVVALVGGLSSVLLDRLTRLEQEAERVEVDLTVRNMRVGLQLAVGERIMRGEEDRLGELAGTNPVHFLGRLPVGYVGERRDGGAAGAWRFDPERRILSYMPRQPEAFNGHRELRWRLSAAGAVNGRAVGLRLRQLEESGENG